MSIRSWSVNLPGGNNDQTIKRKELKMALFGLFGSSSNGVVVRDMIDASTGVSSSMNSAAAGSVDELRILYDVGARFNNQDNDGWTPLFYAVAKHQLECVRYLVSVGVDLNKRAKDGWTALMVAIDHNQTEIVRVLLDAGARTDVFGNIGQFDVCSLVIACRNVNLVRMLLQSGADPNLPHPINGAPPAFFWGFCNGDPDGIRALREYGADFNIKDGVAGQTPLMVNVGNAQRVSALIEGGADPNIRDKDGESAYDYARKPGADPRSSSVLLKDDRYE